MTSKLVRVVWRTRTFFVCQTNKLGVGGCGLMDVSSSSKVSLSKLDGIPEITGEDDGVWKKVIPRQWVVSAAVCNVVFMQYYGLLIVTLFSPKGRLVGRCASVA